MRQAEKKKEKDKIAITLILCFCVIALTSIFAIRSNINKINDSSGLPVSDPAPVSKPEIIDRPEEPSGASSGTAAGDSSGGTAAGGIPTVDSLTQNGSGSGTQDNSNPPTSSRFLYPVNDESAFITNEYSMDSLIYSVTLDQYMTHCGTDIEAPADTQVLAIADGTVTAVYSDDRYGNTVEVTHDDQFVSVYSNLSDASMVETGDVVSAGQIIGGVGSTGLFESLEPAHLHLEMFLDGAYVNPMDYISR